MYCQYPSTLKGDRIKENVLIVWLGSRQVLKGRIYD